MDRHRSDGIVHMCHIVIEPDAEYYEQTGYGTDDGCTGTVRYITRCRDCYQTCK